MRNEVGKRAWRVFVVLSMVASILVVSTGVAQAAGSVVINEMMYNPASDIDAEEFLELHNPGDAAFDLSDMCFDGIDLCFAPGTSIAAGAYEVISPDAATTLAIYGVTTLATYTAKLANGGEAITLYASPAMVTIVDQVDYDDEGDWPTAPDGNGPSLELRDPSGDNNDVSNWGAAVATAGHTAGAVNSLTEGRAVINELMYNPVSDIDADEFLELHNPGVNPVDLSSACFDGIDLCFDPGTTLAGGAFEVISPDAPTTLATYGVATLATYTGKLGNGGETITLTAGDLVTILDQVPYDDEGAWPTQPDGGGPSLELSDPWADNSDPTFWLASFAPALHTAGAINSATGNPPTIENITLNPAMPTDADAVTITALIGSADSVDLTYKVMFGSDVTVAMLDDGLSGDGAAGDDVYGATIPAQDAGELVRYRIDVAAPGGITISHPPVGDGVNYDGYTIADPTVTSNLPVIEWFIDPAVWQDLLDNHRFDDILFPAVFVYDGAVYDNLELRLRGGSTSRSAPKPSLKIEFPSGHDFTHPELLVTPVDEFNMQSEYKDESLGRAHLSWNVMAEADFPLVQSVPVRVQQNGEFWGIYRINEAYDGDWRVREGFSEGAFWKADGAAWENPANKFDKKTREEEGNQEIVDFRDELETSPSNGKTSFLWENVNVPAMINYMAATSLIRQFDQHGHNFYVYYDKEGTDRWWMLPWDFDQTWEPSSNRCGTEPMYDPGCTTNVFLDAMLEVPEFRDMHYRRLRTMMDEMLAEFRYEDFYADLLAQYGDDADLELAMWDRADFSELPPDIATRRAALNGGVGAGVIPGPQSPSPVVVINEIHYNPFADGNEFIELYNPSSSEAIDLSGWTIDAADITIPGGTVLLPESYVVFVEDDAFFSNTHSDTANIFVGGTYSGGFSGGGELVELRDDGGTLVDVVDYLDVAPWPATPDGQGPSLELIAPGLDNSQAVSWAPSKQFDGTPGQENDPDTDGGPPPPPPLTLVDYGDSWNYLDNGSDQGTAWREVGFDDSSWASGPAELGCGDGDEATVVDCGPDGASHITTYYRKDINVSGGAGVIELNVGLVRDDGAVVYINGTEVVRSNMPGGTITATTFAASGVGGSAEDVIHEFAINPLVLQPGVNTVAVEIHQRTQGSGDTSFNLSLFGTGTLGPPDTEDPTTPTNVVGTVGAGTDIDVTWDGSTDNSGTVEYDVLRDGTPIGTTSATMLTDTGVAEGDLVVYTVIARDPSGNESPESDPSAPVGPPSEPPTQPTGLTLGSASTSSVTFSWTASTDNSGSVVYDVYRDGGLLNATANTTYTDNTVVQDSDYSYTVIARDPTGNESAASDPLLVMTPAGPTELIPFGDVWKYLDDGSDQGTDWEGVGFDDSSWALGSAQLGYGDGDEVTVVESGPGGDRHITTYFRRTVNLQDPSGLTDMTIEIVRDDGALVHVNGVEVLRTNMPGGSIDSETRASSTVSGSDEDQVHTFALDPSVLQTGSNVVAVEIHQRGPNSSDISFDLRMEVDGSFGPPDEEPPTDPTNVVAALGAGTSIDISWTGSSDNSGSVEYDVYRDGGYVDTTSATSYNDDGVAEGDTVTYTVIAVDPTGNESGESDPSNPIGPPSEPPTDPSGLSADAVTANAVTMSWTSSTDNSGTVIYDIYRDLALYDSTSSTSYTDTSVTVGETYDYEVVARDPSGNESGASNSIEVTIPPPAGPVDFIEFGDVWSYLDDGSDQGTAWRELGFNDSSWATGESELGYGDGDEATVVEDGPNRNRYITTYFRAEFEVTGAGGFVELDIDLLRDDGAVVYVNGVEVVRSNMPNGTIDYRTKASSSIGGRHEDTVHMFTVDASMLVEGTNVIAVEIHQRGIRSSDISFNLGLTGIV